MAEHEIFMSMPTKIVLNKDTEFDVYSDAAMLGTLKISRGTVEWRPRNFTNGFHVSWEKFDELMQSEGAK